MPVTNVSQDQVQDSAGNLVDVYDITFTVTGHPGTFTVQVPASGDPVQAARDAIDAQTSTVSSIYGL